MKKVKAFYIESCPHCKKAFKLIDELKAKNPDYAKVEIEYIDENKEVKIANTYDYYYVPTFYVDDVKIHEGVPTEEKIKEVFIEAIK